METLAKQAAEAVLEYAEDNLPSVQTMDDLERVLVDIHATAREITKTRTLLRRCYGAGEVAERLNFG